MRLCRLTDENVNSLTGKRICFVEKSVSYLDEICDKYDILSHDLSVADTNRRNLGEFMYRGKAIEVRDLSYLSQMNSEQTVIVITSDYYKEAYEKVEAVLEKDNPDGKGLSDMAAADRVIYYFASRETEYEEYYRARYADMPLADLIIFRSGPHASSYVKGMDFADNARALFEYALEIGLNHTYELVWLVKNPDEFQQYKEVENIRFLSFDWSVSEDREQREAYYWALCLAKYIFFTDAYGFARNCRCGQIRVQLWHGCGFKTRVNFVRCERRYEYTTVISDLYAGIHADIYGLRKDQILVTGYAKEDWLFHPDEQDKEKLKLPAAKKYIFWLPTFRSTERKLEQLNEYELESETGLPLLNTREKLEHLDAFLRQENIVLLIKLHPFQDRKAVRCGNCTNTILLENEELTALDIPVSRLLGWADALISDYSSAAVDYMLLDRPIAFILEDVEEYAQNRGFVFDNIRDWLPGMELYSFGDLCGFIREVLDGKDSTKRKRNMLRVKMHKYNDDNNCGRILENLKIV